MPLVSEAKPVSIVPSEHAMALVSPGNADRRPRASMTALLTVVRMASDGLPDGRPLRSVVSASMCREPVKGWAPSGPMTVIVVSAFPMSLLTPSNHGSTLT